MNRDLSSVCEGCGYNAPTAIFESPANPGGHHRFCRLCANTPIGNARIYGDGKNHDAPSLVAMGYIGNALLDALGLLWPIDGDKPIPGAPTAAEIERDLYAAKVVELESKNRALEKELEETGAALDDQRAHTQKQRGTIALMRDEMAGLQARLAISAPNVPEQLPDDPESIP